MVTAIIVTTGAKPLLAHQPLDWPTLPNLVMARIGVAGVCLLGLLSTVAHAADSISGVPRIVDGDTVQIGETKIRFAGIDAPETDQVCLDAKDAKWACGVAARDHLVGYSAGRVWDCDLVGTDRYGRSLGKCFVEGEDISAWMVRSGWARRVKLAG